MVLVSHYAPKGGYGMPAGSVLIWSASLCYQLVAGHGPRVAPRIADVAPYAAAAAGLPAPVAAYVGVPLQQPDGALFGTLCGFDPEPQSDDLFVAEPLVRLQARLLATVLAHELAADQHVRRAELAEAEASIDVLTGLANRRAWDRIVAREDARCRRYGHPACVLAVDLDGLKVVNDTDGQPLVTNCFAAPGTCCGLLPVAATSPPASAAMNSASWRWRPTPRKGPVKQTGCALHCTTRACRPRWDSACAPRTGPWPMHGGRLTRTCMRPNAAPRCTSASPPRRVTRVARNPVRSRPSRPVDVRMFSAARLPAQAPRQHAGVMNIARRRGC